MSIDEAIRSINYGLKMETTDAPLVRQMTIVRTDALQVALDAIGDLHSEGWVAYRHKPKEKMA